MNLGNIMFITILVIGVLFWGYVFFLAGKEFKEGQIWKNEKENILVFTLFSIAFSIGDWLWICAKGDLHDIGIIITVLSTVGFIIWCVKKNKKK